MALQSNALTTVARVKAQPGLAAKSDADCEEKINLLSDPEGRLLLLVSIPNFHVHERIRGHTHVTV